MLRSMSFENRLYWQDTDDGRFAYCVKFDFEELLIRPYLI